MPGGLAAVSEDPFLLAVTVPVLAQEGETSPRIAAQPLVKEYFWQKVEGRFRLIEKMQPSTIARVRAKAPFTARSRLDVIGPRTVFEARMNSVGGEFGLVRSVHLAGNSVFLSQRSPRANQASRVIRDGDGAKRVLVDLPAMAKAFQSSLTGSNRVVSAASLRLAYRRKVASLYPGRA